MDAITSAEGGTRVKIGGNIGEVSDAHRAVIERELPEISLITDPDIAAKVVTVLASFLRDSNWKSLDDCPAVPGLKGMSLLQHIRQVTQFAVLMADSHNATFGLNVDRDVLLAACFLHDASKLVEYDSATGGLTPLGAHLIHAQIAGVRCVEAGLPLKVAYCVTYHVFTPPHVHLKPEFIELVVLNYADLASVDPMFFSVGKPTHFDIRARFFSLT
jgi:hypothetical protein